MTTYLFYDIETTGLNPCFDQILQFAAIRTDEQLNELERHEINITLKPDVIPSPYALITHQISVEKMQQGEPEYQAMQKIHRLFNTPNTISLGYNTLGFDDEFLRFGFYRNLLPPYTHQYANQCRRMDIYPMTLLYYLYKPEALSWPVIEGRTSLKLEYLNQENNLAEGQAHDAMVDVEVTLALARKLKQHEAMWEYLHGYFDKNTDLNRCMQLDTAFSQGDTLFREGILVFGKLGTKQAFQAPVLSLGQHHIYKNQTHWLRLDLEELPNTTMDNLTETTYVITKKLGEQAILLPALSKYQKHLTEERLALAEKNKAWLQDNPEVLDKIRDYYLNFTYPTVPQIDSQAALYQIGFPSPQDVQLMQRFHQAEDQGKVAEQFSQPVYRELARRILGELAPENRVDYRDRPSFTREQALQEINELLKTADKERVILLEDLRAYL